MPISPDLTGAGPATSGVATATVEDIRPDGVAMVLIAGETAAREAAATLRFDSAPAAAAALLGRTVVVLTAPDRPPVILGVVHDRLFGETAEDADAGLTLARSGDMPVEVRADRKRLDLEAADEIRLTCGKSSLLLRRDGTVIVKGVKIVSRASQANKIRGATVSLN